MSEFTEETGLPADTPTETLEAIVAGHDLNFDVGPVETCPMCAPILAELERRRRVGGDPGTVNWMLAELMRLQVAGMGGALFFVQPGPRRTVTAVTVEVFDDAPPKAVAW